MGIPFPPVAYPRDANQTPVDHYVFKPTKQEQEKNKRKIPTVIHMPLFNIENCGGKGSVCIVYERLTT